MADGILAAVNENGNIDRFIDTKGGVHYIEPKRYEESVAKIDAAATKAKETVNSATEAVSECKAQTGACTQETARAKEIADTVESRITGIEGDVAELRDSVSRESFNKNGVFAERVGGVVTLTIYTEDLSISDNWGTANVCVLPWKPTFTVYFAVILQEGLSGVVGMVKTDGRLVIQGKGTQWRHGWLFGAVSYICA